MATGAASRNEVFVDAGFVIALVNPHDQLHSAARESAQLIRSAATRLITTQAVLLEVGNALAKQRFRSEAVRLLTALQTDRSVEIIPLSSALFEQAFLLFCQRQDKDWGLIDCLSFVVMTERGLQSALSADEHFEQAGFVALLRRR